MTCFKYIVDKQTCVLYNMASITFTNIHNNCAQKTCNGRVINVQNLLNVRQEKVMFNHLKHST